MESDGDASMRELATEESSRVRAALEIEELELTKLLVPKDPG